MGRIRSRWIRLSNGSIVHLDKDPALGDYTVDTDKDGVPDLVELGQEVETSYFDWNTHSEKTYRCWRFISNPAVADTDGDTLSDINDMYPTKYDICIRENTDEYVIFNDGNKWLKFKSDVYGFMVTVSTSNMGMLDPYIKNQFDILLSNDKISWSKEELAILATLDINGVRFYLNDKNKELRNQVFTILNHGEPPHYFKHEDGKWVDKGTTPIEEKWTDFFTGRVRTDADASLTVYFNPDLNQVIKGVVFIGVIAGATYLVASDLLLLVEGISTYGAWNALTMYTNGGSAFLRAMLDSYKQPVQNEIIIVENLANTAKNLSSVTWRGTKVVNGETIVDDIGAFGEHISEDMLAENGWTEFTYIKNASDNGIDIIARGPKGQLGFFEVKTSSTGYINDLTSRQANMNAFVKDVLSKASKGEGPYTNIDSATKKAAEEIYIEFMKNPYNVSGNVIGVDLKEGTIKVSRWAR